MCVLTKCSCVLCIRLASRASQDSKTVSSILCMTIGRMVNICQFSMYIRVHVYIHLLREETRVE